MHRMARLLLPTLALAIAMLAFVGCGDDDSSAYPPTTASGTPTPPANDADSLRYNFSGIEGSVGVIQGQVSNVQALLDQGSQCLKKLAPVWGGNGSDAYQVTQQRWDSTSAELNAALQDLAAKVGEAGAGMQSTEQGVTGMFSYAYGSSRLNINQVQDAAALSSAASEFDGISNELKSAISAIDSTAGELAFQLQGPAGTAAQAAFSRFREAATRQVSVLNDIQQNLNAAGVQYQSAPDDGSSSLGGSMGF